LRGDLTGLQVKRMLKTQIQLKMNQTVGEQCQKLTAASAALAPYRRVTCRFRRFSDHGLVRFSRRPGTANFAASIAPIGFPNNFR
jgi:hypothetical protein